MKATFPVLVRNDDGAQFEKKQSSIQRTNGNLKASKGTASQSGMFRQLTGGLESVVSAIVEQMPSNVTLTTKALVRDISYADAVYRYNVNGREETSHMLDYLYTTSYV